MDYDVIILFRPAVPHQMFYPAANIFINHRPGPLITKKPCRFPHQINNWQTYMLLRRQGDVVKLVEFLRCSLPFSVTKDLFRHVLLNLLSNVPYPY